jgi:hypothetical protein
MTPTILRTLLLALVLVSPAWGEVIPRAPSILEVVVDGEAKDFDSERQTRIKFWLQQLMLSALSQDLMTESGPPEWDEFRQVPKRIYYRYASRATLAIPERPVLIFDEVLLPWHPADTLHWIFVKKDDEVRRLVFWDPWVYVQLITAAEFPTHPRYQHVQRGDW